MKKILLCFTILATTFLYTQAQRGTINGGAAFREQTLMQFPTVIDAQNAKKIRGSRFYDPEYQKGELWTNNGLHFKDELTYKFDEVENSVQIKTKDDKELVVDARLIDSFRLYLNDTKTIYYYKAPVPDGKKGEEKIFQVVYTGSRILLFKIPVKTIKPLNYQGAFGDGRTVGAYVTHHQYYVKSGMKPLVRLKLTKKDLHDKINFKRSLLDDLLDDIEPFEQITEDKVIDIFQKLEN